MKGLSFPSQLIKPTPGEIVFFSRDAPAPRAGTWSIAVPIEPFSADDEYSLEWRAGAEGPYVVSTQIKLDFIEVPAEDLSGLANRAFQFPVNPADGYIDGSIYLCGSHNPVDVTAIEFGPASVNSIRATLVATFDFEFELRDVPNFDLTFSADLIFRRG
jgi:hypothetical protein